MESIPSLVSVKVFLLLFDLEASDIKPASSIGGIKLSFSPPFAIRRSPCPISPERNTFASNVTTAHALDLITLGFSALLANLFLSFFSPFLTRLTGSFPVIGSLSALSSVTDSVRPSRTQWNPSFFLELESRWVDSSPTFNTDCAPYLQSQPKSFP